MIYNSYLAKSDQFEHPLNIDYLQEPWLVSFACADKRDVPKQTKALFSLNSIANLQKK